MKVSVRMAEGIPPTCPTVPDELVGALAHARDRGGGGREEDAGAAARQRRGGEVLSKEPHPEADRLSVCSVEVGCGRARDHRLRSDQFFSGRPRAGRPAREPKLPGGFKIKKSKLPGRGIRGHDVQRPRNSSWAERRIRAFSCSPAHPGIGTAGRATSLLPERQDRSSTRVTANRGDCLGHIGVARGLAAHYQTGLKIPEVAVETSRSRPARRRTPGRST